MTRNRSFREAVYREYMEFFHKAEKNRRWSVFDDIRWDELDPAAYSKDAALCAETFIGVETFLPDYVSKGINIVRDMFGQAWFSANWGYEESKHALSLRLYLVRSGQRSEDEMFQFEEAILGKEWRLPFSSARQMTAYGAIQEQATLMMYRHQRSLARERGDRVLADIYNHICKDEAAHAEFYRRVVSLELLEDRAGMISDLARVFSHFRMPGCDLVPDYEARTEVMRQTGGVDRTAFLKEVWFPTLRKLGITRQETTRASIELRKQERANAA